MAREEYILDETDRRALTELQAWLDGLSVIGQFSMYHQEIVVPDAGRIVLRGILSVIAVTGKAKISALKEGEYDARTHE